MYNSTLPNNKQKSTCINSFQLIWYKFKEQKDIYAKINYQFKWNNRCEVLFKFMKDLKTKLVKKKE